MEKLKNKVAIVTGGSSGIGEATVRLFSQEGASVVIADISESGKELADELNNNGGKAMFIKTDVTQEKDIMNLIEQTVEQYGKLDIMYANAGVAIDAPATELSYDSWKKTIDINLSGVFLSDKYAIAQFKKQNSKGVIVNAGSIHSFVALPTPTAYSSAKGGVKLLTQNLCTAYAKDGIRINAVCPGYVDTPLLKEADDEKKKTLEKLHPQGRLGTPQEVAKAVLFLASDDSTFVNGTTLLVDGGYTAQ
ncbi:SDR family NAD(P)-dependent oxidoreductase [Staphylococcus auricularis]|uniref:SDR family NAD(P)-dependent oxidoreductase n=1 Tax=Staphylococcus auricularis TaxID=29379 RepID=UPI002431CCCD|nr:glucose 1-dehydrogenase [Staphylococcus auricularis]